MTLSTAFAALPTLCATTLLPANAVLDLGNGFEPFTLTQDAFFHAPCPTIAARQLTDDAAAPTLDASSLTPADSQEHQFSDFRDPFYITQFPICYALASTTITAWMLVLILFVNQRSFLDGGVVYLGRRGGFTNGSPSGVNIGGRPWLQKVAALTVAISLTVATANTFTVAEQQYRWGIQNAGLMQREVLGSIEIKVIRLISDTFLWLAQAQTLIRLFPRQREKIIIKWTAFALITLDLIFSALNSFQYSEDGVSRPSTPNSFVHPVPALSYLFQLSLGILYAAWVIYYAITKKRYAFYHPLMKNICLIAIIGITSVIIPVVFFILDISKPDVAGWGDYVRWVGAAAASVVVWEWVERIEALEREEKKDGILGREVFDGDETLEVIPFDYPWRRKMRRDHSTDDDGGENGVPPPHDDMARGGHHTNNVQVQQRQQPQGVMGNILRPPLWPARPAPAATPVSRTDTHSAASTVYAIRYPLPSEATTRTPDIMLQSSMPDLSRLESLPESYHTNEEPARSQPAPAYAPSNPNPPPSGLQTLDEVDVNSSASQAEWRDLTASTNPPASQNHAGSVAGTGRNVSYAPPQRHSARGGSSNSRWAVRARLEEFAANQAERIRERVRPTTDTDNLPVRVIPAPERRGTALRQVLEEEGVGDGLRRGSSDSRATSVEMSILDREGEPDAFTERGADGLPVNNPPLWPGVQPRLMYDDDEYSYDGGSVTEGSISAGRGRQTSDEGTVPGPSRRQ